MVDSSSETVPERVRILIAEDQPLMRQALADFYGGEPGHEVVGVAADGVEAVELASELKPDVILMDIDMPRLNGIDATREISQHQNHSRIVMLTTFSVMDKVSAALRAGASGYLVKDAAPEELLQAIARVMQDETVLSPAVTQLLVDEVTADMAQARSKSPGDDGTPKLTTRELEVLERLAGGLSNKEIAQDLFLSEGSVKLHLGKACDRLGARDRVQLLVRAVEMGMVTPSLARPETAWDRLS